MESINMIKKNKIIKIVYYSIIYAIGFQFFIVPADILSTGFTGIAQIIEVLFNGVDFINYSLIYFIINIPIFILAYFKLGHRFAIYTIFSVVTVSVITHMSVHANISITNDVILNSVFGGVITGYAVGGLLKDGTSSGGTDIIGLYLLKTRNMNFGMVNTLLNMLIILFSMLIFGLEAGLYTMVSLFVKNLTINNVFVNNDVFTIFIVCKEHYKISKYINKHLHRGTTIIETLGGYTDKSNEIIMSVVNQYEYSKLKDYCFNELDDNIFITVMDTKEVAGNYKLKKK